MHPIKKAARIAGAIYLSMIVVAPFSMLYVPGKLIVRGNAAATAENILAHETMFRLSIFGDLIGHVIFICLGIALFCLLKVDNFSKRKQDQRLLLPPEEPPNVN